MNDDDLNLDSVEFLDILPRLLQLHNTVKSTPDYILDNDKNASLLKVFKRLSLPSDKYKGCGGLPKLTLEESKVVITSLYPEDNLINFLLPSTINKNTRNTKASELPGRGDTIRAVINFYTLRRDNTILKPHRSNIQYCSSNLDFYITDLDINRGEGIAIVSPYQKNLLLEDNNGITYEILIKEVLGKLKPYFKESYLVK